MKLVTGIEAIQSGKPWKYKNAHDWKEHGDYVGSISGKELTLKEFIIKEEPREFWIDTSYPDCIQMFPIDTLGVDFSGDKWIRVREVEK